MGRRENHDRVGSTPCRGGSRLTANESSCRPYSTDPDSPRTRKMLQDEYTSYPFPEDVEHFSMLDIHVRKV